MALKRTLTLACTALALAVTPAPGAPALAEAYADHDFSLRFPAALSRFSGYGDVAGVGGASAGSPWGSSVNPAAVAWRPESGFTLSPQAATLRFNEGQRLYAGLLSATAGDDEIGWIQPTVAYVRSNRATDRAGLEYRFRMRYAQIQYGRRLDAATAFGINFNIADSTTRFDVPGVVTAVDSDDLMFGGRAGVLRQIAPRLLGGLVVEGAVTRSRADIFDFATFTTARQRDRTNQVLIRPGISYEYLEHSRAYLDYQYGRFWNDTGTLAVHRAFAGIEQRITDWLYLRGGLALDDRRKVGVTAGLGLYPLPNLSFEVGFQRGFFPELAPNFGRADLFVLSASLVF